MGHRIVILKAEQLDNGNFLVSMAATMSKEVVAKLFKKMDIENKIEVELD